MPAHHSDPGLAAALRDDNRTCGQYAAGPPHQHGEELADGTNLLIALGMVLERDLTEGANAHLPGVDTLEGKLLLHDGHHAPNRAERLCRALPYVSRGVNLDLTLMVAGLRLPDSKPLRASSSNDEVARSVFRCSDSHGSGQRWSEQIR